MKTKSLFLILVLLAAPALVSASVLVSNSFENGYAPFSQYYTGSEVISDETAPDGTHSLQFTFPAGPYGGNAPDIVSVGFPPTNEIWIQYRVKYSSNWRWNKVQNKQVYVWTDAKPIVNMVVGTYSTNGDTINFSTQHNADSTLNQFFKSSGWTFTKGAWHKIVIHVKMNDAGAYNGIGQVWVDDVLRIDRSNVLYRRSGESFNIKSFAMTPVYGGGVETIPSQQYMWFDDVIIQTTPFGASSTSLSATVQPDPPSKLSIQ